MPEPVEPLSAEVSKDFTIFRSISYRRYSCFIRRVANPDGYSPGVFVPDRHPLSNSLQSLLGRPSLYREMPYLQGLHGWTPCKTYPCGLVIVSAPSYQADELAMFAAQEAADAIEWITVDMLKRCEVWCNAKQAKTLPSDIGRTLGDL